MGLSERATAWIEARGLDPELAAKLGLQSLPRGDGGEELAFPFYVGAEVVNNKYRNLTDKRFRQDAGAVKCFWNANAILDQGLDDKPLIITEGEIDAMTAIQAGYVRTVSVPDGAPAREIDTEEQSRKYSYLEHAKAALRDVREIILATDGDGPGQALLNDLAIRLGKARCKWVKYPKGCKDLNETLTRYGERGVHEVFRRAEWCKVDGVYRMSELPPYPIRDRFTTGLDFLDRHYRIRMGDLCVITGVPGHGKSTFVNDILCRVAGRHKWRVAIASFEQHPQADHKRALREWHYHGPLYDSFGHQLVSDQALAEADQWIDEHFVFLVPGDDDLATLEWTLEKCAAAVIRHGVRVVVIDPWNELDHDKPHDMSLTEYTGKAIKEFKRLARSLDVHVIVVAHPTKLGGGECPGLYAISDSAHWANKPDCGIVVWKPDPESSSAEIKIVKSRYHDQIGVPGTVPVVYSRETRRFSQASAL
jgi:twinkle protein